METPAPVQDEPKKSNTGLIIGIVVVILLCCCCVLVAGAAYYASTQYGSGLSGSNPFSAPGGGSSSSTGSGFGGTNNVPGVPSGGRGDDIQRASAWGYVIIATSTDGCSSGPKPDSTQIKVSQEPDSSGVWKEEWTVTCDDGSAKPYTVTFTPGASGSTDIKVTSGN